MINSLKGYAQFIAIQRGLMLFMVTLGGAFLIGGSTALFPGLLLGAIVFAFWSFSDAINNIYDKELDAISDPERAEFTEKLGKKGYFITYLFLGLAFFLGALTLNWAVFVVISVGILLGFVYSAPPIRLRTTLVKPLVNFVFGAVAIFISSAYFGVFNLNVLLLTLFFGIVTSVNSIWGDLADYQSDKNSGAKTFACDFWFQKRFIHNCYLRLHTNSYNGQYRFNVFLILCILHNISSYRQLYFDKFIFESKKVK
ncbi:MAG: UbiA family prenyltransferase [Candidatus Bathyarchaeota archaeon]|nr:UbiA family prenyltransferase [Candidatus Bathyarchaeota archaeon]